MALVDPSQAESFAQSATYKLDLSEVLGLILLDDTDTVSMLGISGEATQTKHQWDEDALNPTTVLQIGGSGLASSGGTLLAISASQLARVTAGTLLRDRISGKSEVLQVTAVGAVSATIVRGYGATSNEAHAASAVWEIISNPRPQGMNGPKDESVARTRAFNYTQIFSKGVQLTGTAMAIEHNGISSEDSYQIDKRLRELKRELDRTVIMGVRAPNDVNTTTYGTMGGLIDFISQIGTTTRVTTAETLTPGVLNSLLKLAWDNGGMPDTIIVGGVQKQKISNFDQEYRRSTLDSRRAGYTVEEFVSDLGMSVRIVVDRWMPNDTIIAVDSSRVRIMPLKGRSFFLEKLAKIGDAQNWQIVGEYTMEIKNANSAHALHSNLKQ